MENPGRTASQLHEVLGEPTSGLLNALSDRNSGFAYLARKVDPNVAAEVKRLNITGISTVPTSKRLYPQGELASQVIGAVGTDNQGLTGIEHSENSVLGGANGEEDVVHDAVGRPLRMETVKPASVGEDVQTTIDAAIQGKTEEALNAAVDHYNAKGGTAIVMNPNTGEVLAMANTPGFNPEDLSNATSNELENRATGFTYEPGSTFKAFTVASALQDHVVTPSSSFYLPSEIHVYDRTIGEAEAAAARNADHRPDPGPVLERRRCDDRAEGGRGSLLPVDQSLRLRPADRCRLSGRGARDRAGERRLLRLDDGQPPDRAGPVRHSDADGNRVLSDRRRRHPAPPDADREGRRPAGRTQHRSAPGDHLADGGTAAPDARGRPCAGGTASEVSVPGYTLAGKTGTAQKVENGTYSDSRYVASFVGFAPAAHPKLLVAVVVDEPQYVHVGGLVAAPVFGQIASFALPYLGISPN